MQKKFLITGVKGQIGKGLLPKLIETYGVNNIVATDVSDKSDLGKDVNQQQLKYIKLDVTDRESLEYVVKNESITNVIHLAGILSALAERDPELAKKVNIDSVHYIFRLAIKYNLSIFIPSTIGVFGPDTEKENVPIFGLRNPIGFYGVSKVLMENLGNYYKNFYNIDFRSIRYVGVVSPHEYAYNGSTDYASEIFFKAKREQKFAICLSENRRLPMAYIDDVINGTLQLLDAPKENLKYSTYNMHACHFNPKECVEVVKKYYPNFQYEYKPDIRDQISKNWPYHYDDLASRSDWGWNPKYDSIEKIAEIMYNKTKIIQH